MSIETPPDNEDHSDCEGISDKTKEALTERARVVLDKIGFDDKKWDKEEPSGGRFRVIDDEVNGKSVIYEIIYIHTPKDRKNREGEYTDYGVKLELSVTIPYEQESDSGEVPMNQALGITQLATIITAPEMHTTITLTPYVPIEDEDDFNVMSLRLNEDEEDEEDEQDEQETPLPDIKVIYKPDDIITPLQVEFRGPPKMVLLYGDENQLHSVNIGSHEEGFRFIGSVLHRSELRYGTDDDGSYVLFELEGLLKLIPKISENMIPFKLIPKNTLNEIISHIQENDVFTNPYLV